MMLMTLKVTLGLYASGGSDVVASPELSYYEPYASGIMEYYAA